MHYYIYMYMYSLLIMTSSFCSLPYSHNYRPLLHHMRVCSVEWEQRRKKIAARVIRVSREHGIDPVFAESFAASVAGSPGDDGLDGQGYEADYDDIDYGAYLSDDNVSSSSGNKALEKEVSEAQLKRVHDEKRKRAKKQKSEGRRHAAARYVFTLTLVFNSHYQPYAQSLIFICVYVCALV